jgi:hypothetical protein
MTTDFDDAALAAVARAYVQAYDTAAAAAAAAEDAGREAARAYEEAREASSDVCYSDPSIEVGNEVYEAQQYVAVAARAATALRAARAALIDVVRAADRAGDVAAP